MKSVKEVIVVEGRYDKNSLRQVVDALIIETSGFGIFNDRQKQRLLRSLAEKHGLIVLTDPDGAGLVIRNAIKTWVDPALVKMAYVPVRQGKEKRKQRPSKEGRLGVEGMPPELLLDALSRAGATFLDEEERAAKPGGITKADLYALGLSGREGSRQARQELMRKLELPDQLSAEALLDVLNALTDLDGLKSLLGADPPE